MACTKDHSAVQNIMRVISIDQGGTGRHKCAACAYELGYYHGYNEQKQVDFETMMNLLPESQAGAQRHKSPHEAYATGYRDGLSDALQGRPQRSF